VSNLEAWENRDRKITKRRRLKSMNKLDSPTPNPKKNKKPRISEIKLLADLDLDEIFKI